MLALTPYTTGASLLLLLGDLRPSAPHPGGHRRFSVLRAKKQDGPGAPLGCYQGRPTIYPGIAKGVNVIERGSLLSMPCLIQINGEVRQIDPAASAAGGPPRMSCTPRRALAVGVLPFGLAGWLCAFLGCSRFGRECINDEDKPQPPTT